MMSSVPWVIDDPFARRLRCWACGGASGVRDDFDDPHELQRMANAFCGDHGECAVGREGLVARAMVELGWLCRRLLRGAC